MKKMFFSILFVVAVLFSSQQTNGQGMDLHLLAGYGGGGLTGTGAIPVGLGLNFMDFNENIKLGVFAAFASTSEDVNMFLAKGTWTYTNIIVAAQSNYHFSPGEKFDPFVGASIGYNVASAKWEWDGQSNLPSPSASAGGLFYSGQIGFNYWMSESMAVQVRAGYFPYVAAGINFKL